METGLSQIRGSMTLSISSFFRRLPGIAYVVPVVLLGTCAWFHQHDSMVAWRALSKVRADSLKAKDKQIDSLVQEVASRDAQYAVEKEKYDSKKKVLVDSVAKLNETTDSLAIRLSAIVLPLGHKSLVTALVKSCQAPSVMLTSRLAECDKLRGDAETQSANKSKLLLQAFQSRDGWKQQYEKANKKSGQPTWLVILENAGSLGLGLFIGSKLNPKPVGK